MTTASAQTNPWTLGTTKGHQHIVTPDGKPFLILGLSHASGAWQGLVGPQKDQALENLRADLRALKFNAVGYVPEVIAEFSYIHNADRLPGSPGTVTGQGQRKHLYEDVFDPAFHTRLRQHIQGIADKTAKDPRCIGYWWTDIPVWNPGQQKQKFGLTYVEFIRTLPEGAPGRVRYESWKKENADAKDDAFQVLIARELYTITAAAYREAAPGKLLFSERYNTIPGAPLEIIAEAGKVVDVISFQPYEKMLKGDILDQVHAMTGKPIILSDWSLSFPVEGHTNTMWPQFPTPAEAAQGYEAYLTSAFAKPYILGYYKCQYRDAILPIGQLKQGLRTTDGELRKDWAQSLADIHGKLIAEFDARTSATQSTSASDRFGGALSIQREATGHFRVEQINVRWMFLTPEGHGYLALGANHTGKYMAGQHTALLNRFGGDEAKAGEALVQTMRDLGLNAGEAYAPFWTPLQPLMPWIANVSYPQGAQNYQFDVFDPAWQAKLRAQVLRESRAVADDPMVIGIAFVDQPDWTKKRLEWFRSLPEGSAGKTRLTEHLASGGSEMDFLGLVADEHYKQLKAAVREAAPKKLFLGERFVLRKSPDAVLKAVGKHVDVFCTQALILSRHRPPEWQQFQADGWDHEHRLTGKPILVVDWAAPFSLGATFESEHGLIKTETEAAEDNAKWLTDALAHPAIVGVFRCHLAGTHGNDRWFEGKAKRTYLKDDGTPFPAIATKASEANRAALKAAYEQAANPSTKTAKP